MGQIRRPRHENTARESRTNEKDDYALTHEEFTKYNNRVELLGNGGFGKVYKVVGPVDPKKVYAMKVIDIQEVTQRYMLESPMKLASPPNTPARTPEMRDELRQHILVSLLNEVKIMKGLKHSNIVSIFHYYMDEQHSAELEKTPIINFHLNHANPAFGPNHLYIIMEYSEYGSLLKYIRSQPRKCLSELVSAGITSQILEGLVYLASVSIVHGDIKAANVLIFPNGVIKLCDFGLSFQWDDENMEDYDDYQHVSKVSSNKQLQKIATNGSAYWLAPEIILHRMATPKSDVWSLGATIIEMLTGDPPFSKRGPLTACHAVGSGSKVEYPSGIGEECKSFLDSCFKYDPTLRSRARTLTNHPWIKHVKKNILEFIEMNSDTESLDDIDFAPLADNHSGSETEKKQLLEHFKESGDDFEFGDVDFDVSTLRVSEGISERASPTFERIDKISLENLKKLPVADADNASESFKSNYTAALIASLQYHITPKKTSRAEQLLRVGEQFLRRNPDELKRFCLSGSLIPLAAAKRDGGQGQNIAQVVEDLVSEVFQSRGREWLLAAGFEAWE